MKRRVLKSISVMLFLLVIGFYVLEEPIGSDIITLTRNDNTIHCLNFSEKNYI